MNTKDIKNLAKLSRLEITDAEAESYKTAFEGILDYIDSISNCNVSFDDSYHTNLTVNMMREDSEIYISGEFTDDMLREAPASENGYFKVRKVL